MPPVERIEKGANLVAIPHIAALKLRQGHVSTVDMVKDG
jgi:hypothetical protein